MNLWESAWVIARRDFVATVFSRFFILFLLAPLALIGFMIFFNVATERQDRAASQPVVAVVTDSATADALAGADAAPGWRAGRRREQQLPDPEMSIRPRMSRPRRASCSPTRTAIIRRCSAGRWTGPC